MTIKCTICKKPLPKGVTGPFCSARCKQVDLGKWLNEQYRVPVEDETPEPDLASDTSKKGRGDPPS